MLVHLTKGSPDPAYIQIADQIRRLIEDGLLEAGAKLPSVRDLARQLGVSVTTVHSAYDLLTAERLIETNQGSGTYVTELSGEPGETNLRTLPGIGDRGDEIEPMDWTPFSFSSDFYLVPPFRGSDDLIRFTLASPDPELFPFKRIKQTVTNMLWNPRRLFFDRGHPQGYLPLVDHLEKEMALSGIPMAEGVNDIVITSGFQRALSVILHLLVRPGMKVAIESPTYSAILNLLLAENIDYVTVPVDDEGLDTTRLAAVLEHESLAALITIPTYHNPTGVTMSQRRRSELIELAVRHRLPVIEDDWGRQLHYEGESPPPLKASDPGGFIIHIGTFSKCFLPGLRLGWVTCPARLAPALVCAKLGADQGDSFFLQALMHEFILKGYLGRHIRKSNREYKRRRNAMVRALREHLPEGCSFHPPAGGFSLWLQLPEWMRSLPLLELARESGVEFLPAAYCMPGREDTAALRLTFSRTPLENIEPGIIRLCKVIRSCLEDPGRLDAVTGGRTGE